MVAIYPSIKKWVNIPLTIKPFDKYSGSGEKLYKAPIEELLCYPMGENNIVRNRRGVDVVSNSKIYVDGDVDINELDSVIINNDGFEYPVQAVTEYYRDGRIDIKVVYI